MTIDEALDAIRRAGLHEAGDAVEELRSYEQRVRVLAHYGYRVMQERGWAPDPIYADIGLVKRVQFGELLRSVFTDYDVTEDRRTRHNAAMDQAIARANASGLPVFTLSQVVAMLEGLKQ